MNTNKTKKTMLYIVWETNTITRTSIRKKEYKTERSAQNFCNRMNVPGGYLVYDYFAQVQH